MADTFTPAHRRLLAELARHITVKNDAGITSRILNIGAGNHVFNEEQLAKAGCRFLCDRVDVADCAVPHPSVGQCWTCSAEAMRPVSSDSYDAAFANYVYEHVRDLAGAAREAHRILKPEGKLFISLPNSAAPEFLAARLTPLWFHALVRGTHAWDTHYSYSSVPKLTRIFQAAGFRVSDAGYYPIIGDYLIAIPVLRTVGRLYDATVKKLGITPLMGNVFLSFQKNASGST